MARAEELRAELEVIALEEQLVALKESGDESALRDCKHRLRAARHEFRTMREGGAVASPATIEVTSDVASPGGVK